jgi:cell division protein FtsB
MAVDHRRITVRAVGATLFGVALYYALWGGEYSAFDLLRLSERQRAETARLEETRQQADSLIALASALENDPVAIEKVARERFGMIREGELLYRFVELDSVAEQPAAP